MGGLKKAQKKSGRRGKATGGPAPKLSSRTWAAIRERWHEGYPVAWLCEQYGVSESTFYRRRKEWGPRRCEDGEATKVVATANAENQGEVVTGEHGSTETGVDLPRERQLATRRHLRHVRTLQRVLNQWYRRPDELTPSDLMRLSQSLERLIKLERTALDMDRSVSQGPQVVIIAPAKQTDEEWHQAAARLISEEG